MYIRTTSLSARWQGRRRYVTILYALWSRVYDATIAWDRAYRENAARMVGAVVRPGDRVLDVGIGTGLLVEFAGSAREYVGIDYSGAMLARAARKVANRRLGHVRLQWGDAQSLPYDDDSFDAAVSSFALPHFTHDQKVEVLDEIARILVPVGRLGLFLAQGEIAPLFSTRDELEELLAGAGFVDIDIEDRDDVYRIVTARTQAV